LDGVIWQFLGLVREFGFILGLDGAACHEVCLDCGPWRVGDWRNSPLPSIALDAHFTEDELKAYRKLAGILLSWNDKQISEALEADTLVEITGRDGVEDGKEASQRSPRRGS
jgi:hypothetical protein